MAKHQESRKIHCSFCTPATDLMIPAMWSSDYALAWFYTDHVAVHAEQLLTDLGDLLRSASLCRGCRRNAALKTPTHRPCYDVDCCCVCSATTTQERSARADG